MSIDRFLENRKACVLSNSNTMAGSQFVCRACDEFPLEFLENEKHRNSIYYEMICLDLKCLPKLGPRLVNNWWPVYEWRRAVKRDFELCVCIFLEHFSFLEAKTVYIERLLSYPGKRWANFKSYAKFSLASKERFTIQRNQALQLFVYFSFCRIHVTASSHLLIPFEDHVCLWFVSIILFTQLEK